MSLKHLVGGHAASGREGRKLPIPEAEDRESRPGAQNQLCAQPSPGYEQGNPTRDIRV